MDPLTQEQLVFYFISTKPNPPSLFCFHNVSSGILARLPFHRKWTISPSIS